jgi:diguanylate cyclase (GGDEF)-like protein/PAS domain S-box-containing protein
MSAQIPLTDELCFHALMDNTADSIYFKDRECRLQRVSRKMALDLGFQTQAEIYGKTDVELFGEEFGRRTMVDDTRIMETEKPLIGLIENRRLKNGQLNWTLTSKLPIYTEEGVLIGLMGITREINELKENEINLQYLATHDALTDLPNRYLMNDRLEQILGLAKRSPSIFALVYIDLNGFKEINDSYGHDIGDLLLNQVAKRLKDCARPTDTVARLGGDEFLIVFAAITRSQDVTVVANKVEACFDRPFAIESHRLKIKASIGVSLYPDHGEDQETLIKAADYAMYLSKKRDQGFVICPPDNYTLDKGHPPAE